MSDTFAELYTPLLKEVFIAEARQQLDAGADGLASARTYAERGKPDFALAFLLLVDAPDTEKCELLAYAFERRARLSEEKAEAFNNRFHRTFPLIKLEAQKDRVAARSIRQGLPVREHVTKFPPTS